MNNFFGDTMQGLIEAIESEKGNIPLTERKEMPAPTFYVSSDDRELVDKLIEKGGDCMPEKEMMQRNIEEFVQLQNYMLLADKESDVYKAMKIRYNALKVILTSSGINLTEIDRIKE